MSEFVKICPYCKTVNNVDDDECVECTNDIMATLPIKRDEIKQQFQKISENDNNSQESEELSPKIDIDNLDGSSDLVNDSSFSKILKIFKICPSCKKKLPVNLVECDECEVSITDERQWTIAEWENEQKYQKELESRQFRVCPECKAHVLVKESVCSCGTNLESQKKWTQEEWDEEQSKNEKKELFVKICPVCKTENKAIARTCEKCGANIKLTPKSCKRKGQSVLEKNSFTGRLVSLDGEYEYKMDPNEPIIFIGRANKMADYLMGKKPKMYVSSKHAKLKILGKCIVIQDGEIIAGKEDWKSTNGTFVNNEKLKVAEERVLKEGDKLSLGGIWSDEGKEDDVAYFIVKYE